MRLVSLVLLAGCDIVLGISEVHDAGSDAAVSFDARQRCPVSYLPRPSGASYRLETTAATWYEAETACARDGAALGVYTHLAVLGSIAEVNDAFDFVHPMIPPESYAWIGLSDRQVQPMGCPGQDTTGTIDGDASTFLWVTAENLTVPSGNTTPWYDGDPRRPCSENCVRTLNNVARYTNVSCSGMFPSLCECDAYPADPARF